MPAKKRKAEAPPSTDTTKSVLGGMLGGYRVDGSETQKGVTNFDVPFEGKSIVCQRHGGNEAELGLIFTHGAGGGLDNPATKLFAEGFASTAPVVCFQGTMNLKSRTKSFVTVIEHENWGKVLGGRSMGARAAVLAAQESDDAKSLVLVSYPLKSPQGDVRDQILLDLSKDMLVLFVIGSNDNMCELGHLNKVREKMKASSWLIVVEGADHGMSLKTKPAVETMRKESGAVSARWVKNPEAFKRKCSLRWDAHARQPVFDGETNGGLKPTDQAPSETKSKRQKK